MASRSASAGCTMSKARSAPRRSRPWRSASRWPSPRRSEINSRQMALHFRARLQCGTLPSDNLDDALRREVHIDKAGRRIGDLVIFRDLAVAELHDRDALEHRARPLGLGPVSYTHLTLP